MRNKWLILLIFFHILFLGLMIAGSYFFVIVYDKEYLLSSNGFLVQTNVYTWEYIVSILILTVGSLLMFLLSIYHFVRLKIKNIICKENKANQDFSNFSNVKNFFVFNWNRSFLIHEQKRIHYQN